jgi:dCTP deaminase
MILSEADLKRELKQGTLTIDPLSQETVRENGADLRISSEITRLKQNIADPFDITLPKNDDFFSREQFAESFVLKPYEKILVATIEKIIMPNNLMAFCQLRSTFARAGVSIPPTVVDAGFSGNLTIQMSGSSFPVSIPAKARFLHLIFSELKSPPAKGYSGKYQNDKGVALPKTDHPIAKPR